MQLDALVRDVLTGGVEVLLLTLFPLVIRELHIVQLLKLHAYIGQHSREAY